MEKIISALITANLPAKNSGHSFRIGAATTSAIVGLEFKEL